MAPLPSCLQRGAGRTATAYVRAIIEHGEAVLVGALDVPFTIPAASAKTSAGFSPLHVLYSRPS